MLKLSALLLFATPTMAHASGGGFDPMQLMPIVMIGAVFYFLLLRPQQKKTKNHQEMLKSLHKGDRVITSGGIIANIHKIVNDTEVLIEVEDHVKIRVLKSMIIEVMGNTEKTPDAPKALKAAEATSKKGK